MSDPYSESEKHGEIALERLELIGEAGMYLRRSHEIPAALLFRLYGSTRLDCLSRDELLDFIRRCKRGLIGLKRG